MTRSVGWAPEHDVPINLWPVEPVTCALSHREGTVELLRQANLHDSYYRAKRDGVMSTHVADQLACRILRTHPCLVWGPAWWGP